MTHKQIPRYKLINSGTLRDIYGDYDPSEWPHFKALREPLETKFSEANTMISDWIFYEAETLSIN